MRNLVQAAAPLLAAAALLTLPSPPARAQAEAPMDGITRELTLFVASDETASDAVSREITLWAPTAEGAPDANTREMTVWTAMPEEPLDASTREFTSYVPPYGPEDALTALRIAAGFLASSPADATRLNVVLTGLPPEAITLEDAARLLRLVLHLEP